MLEIYPDNNAINFPQEKLQQLITFLYFEPDKTNQQLKLQLDTNYNIEDNRFKSFNEHLYDNDILIKIHDFFITPTSKFDTFSFESFKFDENQYLLQDEVFVTKQYIETNNSLIAVYKDSKLDQEKEKKLKQRIKKIDETNTKHEKEIEIIENYIVCCNIRAYV